MILTAHQPVYLPWLGLFHKIALSDAYCYFDDVQYLKKDWNNRNRIKTDRGEIWLTVPVLTEKHREKTIREVKIDNTQNWAKKHWKSIYLNYKKAPYFEHYSNFFEQAYNKKWEYIANLDEYFLKWFLKQLGIEIEYRKASELNFKGQKSDLVLDMCKKLRTDLYIFGEQGAGYAREENFAEKGIKLYFQKYDYPQYPQIKGNFIPYLSIIDLLFNCGPKSLEVLMKGNITKQELIKKFNL